MTLSDSTHRIVRKQRFKEARAWLEDEPARLSLVEEVLAERAQLESLRSMLQECRRTPSLLKELAKDQDLERIHRDLHALVAHEPTSEAYRNLRKAELFYRPIEVGPTLLRSCQPRLQHLTELCQSHDLQMVINLRSESHASRPLCEKLGLDYHQIAIEDDTAPTLEQVETFLSLLRPGKRALVHCMAGKGRTGALVACYRVASGVDGIQAIALTEKEVAPMHRCQREFVLEFEQFSRSGASER